MAFFARSHALKDFFISLSHFSAFLLHRVVADPLYFPYLGGFGYVYLATDPTGEAVAVKKLILQSDEALDAARREIAVMVPLIISLCPLRLSSFWLHENVLFLLCFAIVSFWRGRKGFPIPHPLLPRLVIV